MSAPEREVRACGRVLPHPAHLTLQGRVAYQCRGIQAAAEITSPLSEQQLAEIAARAERVRAMRFTTGLNAASGYFDTPVERELYALAANCWNALQAQLKDADALLAEVARLRADSERLQAIADREHKAFIDTHNALNLLAQDAQRVMAENGVQAQQAELERAREQAAKFKEQRGEWAKRARIAEASVSELLAERHSTNEALDDAVAALREKERLHDPEVVAYRAPASGSLYCAPCHAGDIYTPMTTDDLPDGGLCAACDVDVLIGGDPR